MFQLTMTEMEPSSLTVKPCGNNQLKLHHNQHQMLIRNNQQNQQTFSITAEFSLPCTSTLQSKHNLTAVVQTD